MQAFINFDALIRNIGSFAAKPETVQSNNRQLLVEQEIEKAVSFIVQKYTNPEFATTPIDIPYKRIEFWRAYFNDSLDFFEKHENYQSINPIIRTLFYPLITQLNDLCFLIQNKRFEAAIILSGAFIERCTVVFFLINHPECIDDYLTYHTDNKNQEYVNDNQYGWARKVLIENKISFLDLFLDDDFDQQLIKYHELTLGYFQSNAMILINKEEINITAIQSIEKLLPSLLTSLFHDGFHELSKTDIYCHKEITSKVMEAMKKLTD